MSITIKSMNLVLENDYSQVILPPLPFFYRCLPRSLLGYANMYMATQKCHLLYNKFAHYCAYSLTGGFFVIKYREILRLNDQGLSNRSIASSCGCSRNTVNVIKRANDLRVSWPLKDDITDTDLRNVLYPEKGKSELRKQPDCVHIHKEMAKSGVTLSQLWHEYSEACRQRREIPYSYRQFQYLDRQLSMLKENGFEKIIEEKLQRICVIAESVRNLIDERVKERLETVRSVGKSLEDLIAYFGKSVPTQYELLVEGLQRNAYSPKGWIHKGLAELGESYGLRSAPIVIKNGDQLEHILKTTGPVIASVTHTFPEDGRRGGHLVVVCSRHTESESIISFLDPSRWGASHSTVTEKRFFSSFTGRGIYFFLDS